MTKDIVKDILEDAHFTLFEEQQEVAETIDRYVYNGFVWTKSSNLYSLVEEELADTNISYETKFEDGLYKIEFQD